MKYSLQKWKADVEKYAIQKQDGEGKEINNQELIGDLTTLDLINITPFLFLWLFIAVKAS